MQNGGPEAVGGLDSMMEDEISGMVLVPESVKMKTASWQRWAVKWYEDR